MPHPISTFVLSVVALSLWLVTSAAEPAGATCSPECAPAPATPARSSDPSAPYVPPVDRPVSDPFRPPATPYGAGNLGLEYDTQPGDEIRSIGAGTVAFAGAVGASLHVSVDHPDGRRSTYSFLADTVVSVGDQIEPGAVLATAGESFLLTVREGERYLDPAPLLDRQGSVAVLVPFDAPTEEGGGWLDPLDPTGATDLLLSLAEEGSELVAAGSPLLHQLGEMDPLRHLLRIAEEVGDDEPCSDSPPPPPPPERRIVVLVGGIGSSSEGAAIEDLDTSALGYDGSDVVRFSYNGGIVPGGGLDLPASGYRPQDTDVELELSAARLRALLEDVGAELPGVPIDVVAHSQGGVVARLALAGGDMASTPVENLVTIATPHAGTDLATAAAGVADGRLGDALLGAADLLDLGFDPSSASVMDMAETSPISSAAGAGQLPSSVDVLTIGARGDLVVPSPHTDLEGSAHVVVDLGGLGAHHDLPGDPRVTGEIARLLGGEPPSCSGVWDRLLDAATGEGITFVEDGAGLALNLMAG